MLKRYLITPLLLVTLAGVCQKTTTALGANLNFLHNKIYGGVQFSILKETKLFKTIPSWTFQFNYGIFGAKHIKQISPDTTGGGITLMNANSISYDIPPNGPKTNNRFYTKEQNIKNIGWSFHFAKEFKISKFTFFGVGMGYAHIRDKGYLIWEDPFTNVTIEKNIDIDVSTVYFLVNLGFHYDLNKKWFINGILNLYFHTPVAPVNKDDKRYRLEATLPTLGTEQDISISINYKF
jgi:hypothetical protein